MFDLYQLATEDLIYLALGAFLIGVEKAGLKGLSMIAVSLYAIALGGKASAGLLLLLFMLADVFAVRYYYQEAQAKLIKQLLGPAMIGLLVGGVMGNMMDDALFKNMIAIIILLCLGLMAWPKFVMTKETGSNAIGPIVIGLLAGFGTMIANVSSPILAIYLLAVQLPKKQFIGTIVWFFFIINFLKLPFHIWSWQTISWDTCSTALMAIPVIAVGFGMGLWLIKRIGEKSFRYLIIGVTLIAAVRLLLG